MIEGAIRILLIEDNPGDSRMLCEELAHAEPGAFAIGTTDTLVGAIKHLEKDSVDAVLLNLNLPDSKGLPTLESLRERFPRLPIVVLGMQNDEAAAVDAVDAVNAGAQDYIVFGQSDPGNVLMRAIIYAIERSRLLDRLRNLAVTDELTGLYNRRGFETVAAQHLRLARRTRKSFALFFADLDDLKVINDSFGHNQGDQAIKDSSNVLKSSFRDSDIMARIGGDEFLVLASDCTPTGAEVLTLRLQDNITMHNKANNRDYELGISMGSTCFDSSEIVPIPALIEQADSSLYSMKQDRKSKA
jgi:two-component system cell cycle response regulator